VQTNRTFAISLPVNAEAGHLIAKLGMAPLPKEGGFYVSTWSSPKKDAEGRRSGSAILFLITENDFSALHRIGTDEIWHFHAGDPAELIRLNPRTGSKTVEILGPDVAGDHRPQVTVPAGEWQGARIRPLEAPSARGWTLFGCTLSPAWDEREFELGCRETLLCEFPEHREIVCRLTR
jgi:hypothetical protein